MIRRKKVHASKLTECQHEIDYKRFNNQPFIRSTSQPVSQPTKFKFNFMLINFHSGPNRPKHVLSIDTNERGVKLISYTYKVFSLFVNGVQKR